MDYAFTDQMVRSDRYDLTEAAETYLRNYKGSFEPILEARRAMLQGAELNVAEIRMILNVMRADTSVRIEYTPPPRNVIQFPRRPVPFFDDDEPIRRDPVWYRLKAFKLKMPFAMSLHKRAEVIHYISNDRSECHYHPIGSHSQGRKVFEPFWDFRVAFECSATRPPKMRMLTTYEAFYLVEAGYMRLCRTCLTLRTDRA